MASPADLLEDMEFEEVYGIPNLSVLKPDPDYQQVPMPRQISLFKLDQDEKTVQHWQQQQQQQQRQTNQPVSPPEEPMSTDSDPAAGGVGDCGASPPSLQWLDSSPDVDIAAFPDLHGPTPLVTLSSADVRTFLDGKCPSPPDVTEEGSLQGTQIQLTIQPQQRQRRDTITLVPHDAAALELDSDVFAELMHGEGDDDSALLPFQPQPSFRARSRSRTASSSSQSTATSDRSFDRTASYILEMHQALAKSVPIHKAKQKPMLHEFLGYVLFCADTDPDLAVLRDSVHFCDEFGCKLQPNRASSAYFKVADFKAVSAVWRLIKNNNSEDCAKNMKRAMRMSTSNQREYFVNLSQRKHRMQVFMFGSKSLEFFNLVFRHGLQPAAHGGLRS